ncbi:MAG: hypothetical protein Q9180_004488 [Flavoplaca navasiana]
MFLLKWQHFIDQTPITPGPNNGPPRTGKSESVVDATAVDIDGEKPPVIYQQSSKIDALSLEPPDVSAVVRLLEPGFKSELQRIVASKERKGQSVTLVLMASGPGHDSAKYSSDIDHFWEACNDITKCLSDMSTLSSAQVLDSDAERLCCMLSWEHHRLLHFSDMATLDQMLTSEPLQKQADWAAIRMTLSQLKDLLGDRSLLNQKYGFTYSESIPRNDGTANKANEAKDGTPANTYSRLSLLFRSKFSGLKCTVMEEAGIQRFLFDVSQSIGRLYSAFDSDINEQEALLRAQRRKLEEAMLLSVCTFDREIIHQLAERTLGSGIVKSKGWESCMLEHELLEAIDAGALTAIIPLLDRGATANTMDILGCSPLTFSAYKGNFHITEVLLEHGADPNAMTSWLPQHLAAERGHTQVLRLLLSQEGVDVSALDPFGRTALHYAATSGNLEIVHLLLQQDGVAVDITDKDGSTPLFAAVAKRFFPPTSLSQTPKGLIAWRQPGTDFTLAEEDIIRRLLTTPEVDVNRQYSSYRDLTLLHMTVLRKNLPILQMLLSRSDIDISIPDISGTTPILSALEQSNEPASRLLLEKGADIDSRAFNKKFKALYKAFRFWPGGFLGNEFLLDFALRHGKARIDTEDCEDRTELIGAAAAGHASVVRILLDHGASVSALDVTGRTALSYAAAGGHTDIVAMLLDAGADINHQDDSGHTPLVLAVAELYLHPEDRHPEDRCLGYSNVIQMLLDHGADPQDVLTLRHPPTSRPLWVEAVGNFENIPKAHNRFSNRTVTQNPDRPILVASRRSTSLQDEVPGPTKGDQQSGRVIEVCEFVSDLDAASGNSVLLGDEALPGLPQLFEKTLSAKSWEGGNESQPEEPKAPVLYLTLEDEFAAKVDL